MSSTYRIEVYCVCGFSLSSLKCYSCEFNNMKKIKCEEEVNSFSIVLTFDRRHFGYCRLTWVERCVWNLLLNSSGWWCILIVGRRRVLAVWSCNYMYRQLDENATLNASECAVCCHWSELSQMNGNRNHFEYPPKYVTQFAIQFVAAWTEPTGLDSVKPHEPNMNFDETRDRRRPASREAIVFMQANFKSHGVMLI